MKTARKLAVSLPRARWLLLVWVLIFVTTMKAVNSSTFLQLQQQQRRQLHQQQQQQQGSDAATSVVSLSDYLPFGIVRVTLGKAAAGNRRQVSVLVACASGDPRPPAGTKALKRCTPVCADGFATGSSSTSSSSSSSSSQAAAAAAAAAGLVCASLNPNKTPAEGHAAAVTPLRLAGAGRALKWAARRPSLSSLTCPDGAASAADCIALLTPTGCTALAAVNCSATAPPPPPPPPPPAPLPAECGPLMPLLQTLAFSPIPAVRRLVVPSIAPHGTVRLVNGPVPGQTGVVQISYCGYWGTVSTDSGTTVLSSQPSELEGGGTDVNSTKVANALRAAAICTQLGFSNSRHKRGSAQYAGGEGFVWGVAPVCRPGVAAPLAAGLARSFLRSGGQRYNASALQVCVCGGGGGDWVVGSGW
ncbi:hypothetical protein CHLRE_02g097221v5 [Chlamydomonas reinhardtii]|uniref:SRCR domain-containing protein n=1 Tax=Chlamydomonas reinhardtii TaxID=3055 RepID=A0A2K3E233_CHLRE|nr:uncharacterized protein CHLRE_02g097221v5 [Chlamydomonas reinhardtii]PNW86826.1 hypothetical protein CHLRE_02g097221v5 [Chlamydomonas reinhardtii]